MSESIMLVSTSVTFLIPRHNLSKSSFEKSFIRFCQLEILFSIYSFSSEIGCEMNIVIEHLSVP